MVLATLICALLYTVVHMFSFLLLLSGICVVLNVHYNERNLTIICQSDVALDCCYETIGAEVILTTMFNEIIDGGGRTGGSGSPQ